jgi:hypothetical protein
MIGLIPPTIAVMQGGVITPAEAVWWSQEVTMVVISAMMTGLLLGLVQGMAEAV